MDKYLRAAPSFAEEKLASGLGLAGVCRPAVPGPSFWYSGMMWNAHCSGSENGLSLGPFMELAFEWVC